MATKKKKAKKAKSAGKRAAAARHGKGRASKARRAPARTAARKAAPRRAVAKARKPSRPAPRKTAPKRAKAVAPARKVASPVKKAGMRREDHAGHLDPRYAADLRARSEREPREPQGFLAKARTGDTLVESLGEDYVGSATSGEYEAEDNQNQDVSEEVGGPFVQTTGDQEFARGTDASNPKGSTREPFPRT